MHYIKIWLMLTGHSFQAFLSTRLGAILFLLGKVVRFLFYLFFLLYLVSRTKVLAGYDIWQILLFYMTFNMIDAATQMLFREVYRFRNYILTGSFDLILVKPVNSLFRCLFGGTDLLDMITLLPFIVGIVFILMHTTAITFFGVMTYILLIINALIIAMSYHILVLGLAVITTEIDHAVMIYRDITSMGKLPVDIYKEPLRGFITFFIPVGIMMTFPVKSLFGLLQPLTILLAGVVSFGLFVLSVSFWRFALRQYTSASS